MFYGENAMAMPAADSNSPANGRTPTLTAGSDETKHISVCVCSYKRPDLLKRLLGYLDGQDTDGRFTYSIVVADNDHSESSKSVVSEFSAASRVPIKYCVEPQQNIALARNKAAENAAGDFIAFIDDDEFPVNNWLLSLFDTCNQYNVDGVLGPVRRHFDEPPPKWLAKSNLYQRRIYPTGTTVHWLEAHTGNVLVKKEVLTAGESPFRPEFRAREDQDFFRRKIEQGRNFIWCADAVAYEVVPPARWKRTYMLRKALLWGQSARLQPSCGPLNIAKSFIAVPVYTVALPLAFVLGHHRFMTLLVKLFHHLGKLLALLGFNPIREPYVTG
jgi:succinoglycan biosynthesis protein ExoM